MDINQIKPSQGSVASSVKRADTPQEAPKQTATDNVHKYSESELQDVAKTANETVGNGRIRFEVEPGEPPVIVIVDPETDEIIKQIPPEELQRVSEMINAIANGENPLINFIDRYA